jgi:hypothetical protein
MQVLGFLNNIFTIFHLLYSRSREEYNIKMDLRETGREGTE